MTRKADRFQVCRRKDGRYVVTFYYDDNVWPNGYLYTTTHAPVIPDGATWDDVVQIIRDGLKEPM